MDIFTRFNRDAIDERQIDVLTGLAKGIIADGAVNLQEATALHAWLVQAKQATDSLIVANLLPRVQAMLCDGKLDDDESAELLTALRNFTGDASEVGELAKPALLPLDKPAPPVLFPGKLFVFTGTCVFGSRVECEAAIIARGGMVHRSVTQRVDYLVLGTYVTESWAHETYGRKIETAMDYRSRGLPIAIVSESHWLQEASVPDAAPAS